jgi:ribosomal protein L30E
MKPQSEISNDIVQDDSFISILYDIIKKHPILFIVLFLLPLIALIISMGLKWHYVFSDTTHYLGSFEIDANGQWTDKNAYFSPGIDRYIRELDIAGLLGGIVGIFIGLYITVTTEKLNRQKERLNQQEMDRIKTQTGLLVQATASLNTLMIDVSGKVNEKVQLMEGTGEVLVGISKVIDSVKSQGNNLLVLSNTARIEGISPYRMEYVAKHADLKPHELKNATQFDYARKAEALQRDCTDVENKLKEVAIYLQNMGSDAKVEFVTLNDQSEGATHAFLKYLGKVFNEHVSVETYRSGSNALLSYVEGMPHHNRFLVANNSTEIDNPQAFLVKQLYDQQAQAVRELTELGIRITKINKTLPIQLYISAPLENKPGIYKGLCVCILGSGSSTSGRASKLTAFLTDDPHIVASMTELFYDYENDAQMNTKEFIRPV